MKFLPFLLIPTLALLQLSHAENSCEDCQNDNFSVSPVNLSSINSLAKTLPAACPKPETIYLQMAERAFNEQFPDYAKGQVKNETRTLGGLSLTDSAEILELTQTLLGTQPIYTWQNARGCKTAICALQQTYGSKEAALRALTIAKKNGYALSLSQEHTGATKNAVAWNTDEIRLIHETLLSAPSAFTHIATLQDFVRMPPDAQFEKKESIAQAHPPFKTNGAITQGHIRFLGSTFKTPTWARQSVLHELVHEYDFEEKILNGKYAHQDPDFWKMSGWVKEEPTEIRNAEGQVVLLKENYSRTQQTEAFRDYSLTDPFEDLADTIAYAHEFPDLAAVSIPNKATYAYKKFSGGKKPANRQWPALTRALKNSTKDGSLLLACLKKTELICYDAKQKESFYYPTNAGGHFIGIQLSQFLGDAGCLSEIAKNLESQLEREADYCERLLTQPLSSYLRAEANPGLSHFFKRVTEFTEGLDQGKYPRCSRTNGTAPLCVRERLAPQRQAQLIDNPALSEKTWDALMDEMTRIVSSRHIYFCK